MIASDELALCEEWDSALRRLRRCDTADLPHIAQVLSIPASVFTDNLIGLENVIVDGEQYQPHESGTPAFITPAFWHERIIDLVAWHPASPDRWATRAGLTTLLGDEHWEQTRVHRSIVSWCRSGCDGIVPLTPTALLWLTTESLVAEDQEHRRSLIRAYMQPRELPRITI